MNEEFDRSLARFGVFLNTEPVLPVLSRNLTFLLDENRLVDSVETDDGLRCRTEGRKVVVSGAPFLMRDEYDRRHWTAAMRVFLAHEVQHDNSSDRAVLDGTREWYGNYLHDMFGLEYAAGSALGGRVLNALENGRVNNIVCQRFPGYISMLRFVNYARRAGGREPDSPASCGRDELLDFLANIDSLAVTGIGFPGGEAYAGTRLESESRRLLGYIDSAVLAESARECAVICENMLRSAAPYLAELCGGISGLSEFLQELAATLEEYQYSDADRREQLGDGSDAGARSKKRRTEGEEKSGDSGEDESGDANKGDSGSPGSGDNDTRQGDESGSLTGEEAKPKNTAGNYGREDRGKSLSDGRSSNHGMTGSGDGMKNSGDDAAVKAAEAGPESIREVIGAGYSAGESPALTRREIDDMLKTAAAELDRESAHQKNSRVEAGERTPLSKKDAGTLKSLYKYVSFTEKFVTPKGGRLPGEYMEEANELHRKLDRLLREQRVRTANQRKGSLSQKALWKAEVNDPDIFQRKSPPSTRESAFYLLVDRSGSMGMGRGDGNSKLFTALMTAAVIEEALKGLAYTKIVAFDGGNDIVEHCIIKDFNQKESGNRCFDALSQVWAGNGNKDGYSIRVAAADLEKRQEKRKVLLVLSDGLPSAYSKESEAIADVRSAVQEARRRGIIVIPIMYGVTDSAESFQAYQQMYEKGIISTNAENILSEFEKLIFRLIK